MKRTELLVLKSGKGVYRAWNTFRNVTGMVETFFAKFDPVLPVFLTYEVLKEIFPSWFKAYYLKTCCTSENMEQNSMPMPELPVEILLHWLLFKGWIMNIWNFCLQCLPHNVNNISFWTAFFFLSQEALPLPVTLFMHHMILRKHFSHILSPA